MSSIPWVANLARVYKLACFNPSSGTEFGQPGEELYTLLWLQLSPLYNNHTAANSQTV